MQKKRIMTLLLTAAMLLSAGAATSCGKKNTGPVKSKRTNVYSSTPLELPEDITYIQNMVCSNDTIYLMYTKQVEVKHYYDGTEEEANAGQEPGFAAAVAVEVAVAETEVEVVEEVMEVTDDDMDIAIEEPVEETEDYYIEYVSQTWLYSTDLTGENKTLVQFQKPFEGNRGYMRQLLSEDGQLYALYETWGEMEGNWLYQIDPVDGSVTKQYDLSNAKEALGMTEDDYFYPNSVALSDNTAYINCDAKIVPYDLQSETFGKAVDLSDKISWTNAMYAMDDSLYYAGYVEGKGQTFFTLDLTTGESTAVEIEGITYYNPIGDHDGKIYFTKNDGILAYDTVTGTSSEVINYINCDINPTEVNTVVLTAEGRMAYYSSSWNSMTEININSLQVLDRIPDEQMQEEVLLTIASAYYNYDLQDVVIGFNRQNTGVRLNIKDYDEYNTAENNYEGAVTQLNADITMGNVPDLLVLDSELPVESYFSKGVLVDLYPYMDSEENGIDRSQYLENVFKACEQNGKLYSLITSFNLATLSAKSAYVGDTSGWTMTQMLDAIEAMPEGMRAFSDFGRDDLLERLFSYCGDIFIDWETGTTNFESEDFIRLIEFLKTCPEKSITDAYYDTVDYDNYDYKEEEEFWNNYSMRYYKDTALFNADDIYRLNGYTNVHNTFAGDATMIGYPTNDDGNGAVIQPNLEIGICASSVNRDSAWVFLKYLLTNEDYFESVYSFTVAKKWLDKSLAESEEYYQDWYGGYTEEDLTYMREQYSEEYVEYLQKANQKYTLEQGQKTYDLVVGATKVVRTNDDLLTIIKEELSSFFGGGKSAEEAARIINSRARVYVAENS